MRFMPDSLTQQLWLGASALAAGAINSVAGGGTLLTFPALLAALAPLETEAARFANATSTVYLPTCCLGGKTSFRGKTGRAANS